VQQASRRKTGCKRGWGFREDDGAGARGHATYSDAQSSAHRPGRHASSPVGHQTLQGRFSSSLAARRRKGAVFFHRLYLGALRGAPDQRFDSPGFGRGRSGSARRVV